MFYIALLIAISYKVTYSVYDYWDILGADEVTYLKFGKSLFHELHFEWGFLYNVWYKFLSIFEPSTIELYYLNYRVLVTAIPILLFICLIVYDVHALIAFSISFLYLISALHITTWPFVSNFCIIIILSFFIIIKFMKDDGWKVILLTFFTLLLYLVRPEFILSFVCAIILSFYYNKRNKKRWLLLITMLSVLIYIGKQTTVVGGIDRGFFAYAQHYAVTYKIWHRGKQICFYEYIELVSKLFGKSQTLIGSILYNPTEAIRHFFTCIAFYFLSLIKSIEDLLLPSVLFKFLGKFRHLFFIAIILTCFVIYKKYKAIVKVKEDKILFFSLASFFMAGIIPNFLIGFNMHYLQLHFILYLLYFAIGFLKVIQFNSKSWMNIVLGILLILITPDLKRYSFEQADYTESKNLPIQKLAIAVNKINDNKSHSLLAFQTNIHFVFEGNNFTGFDAFSINKPFLEFINQNKVDFIYINKQLLDDEKLSKDAGWKLFIDNPEKHGFIKKELIGSKNYLLIKSY